MVRHQTSTDLQIKFHFYGGLIGGGAEVMGREVKTHGRCKNGDVLHGFTSLVSTQEYGGWTRPGGIMVMRFLPAVQSVGGDPACHPQIKCPTHN